MRRRKRNKDASVERYFQQECAPAVRRVISNKPPDSEHSDHNGIDPCKIPELRVLWQTPKMLLSNLKKGTAFIMIGSNGGPLILYSNMRIVKANN